MKKLFLITAMIAICSTVSAQSSKSVNSDGWNTLYVQYNPITLKSNDDDVDGLDFTGFTLGYNKALYLSQGIPLYLEVGAGLTYAWYSNTKDYTSGGKFETKINILTLKVPVSILYNILFPNSNISLRPFAGLTLRYNLSGKLHEEEFTDEGQSAGDGETNIFDKDDIGAEDTYKRFQIGWQIGVNAVYKNNYIIGLSYGSDFSEIARMVKASRASITLGYCF